jgi:hypothetical protein
VSLDGIDYRSLDLASFVHSFRECEMSLLWTDSMNGIGANHNFIDPRQRADFPSASEFAEIGSAMRKWEGHLVNASP